MSPRAGREERAGRGEPGGREGPVALAGAVRRAGVQDLDRLAALWTGLFHDQAQHDAERFELLPGAEEALHEVLAARVAHPDAAVFTWADGRDLPGLCIAALAVRPPLFVETRRGEIEQLVVREGARRRGIGRALAQAAFDWLREEGAARVEIQVAAANAEGRAFWEALGFGRAMDVLDRSL